jgi:broad specificity phosphatase PhoE
MEIVLARHGKPRLPAPGDIRGAELSNWVRRYNAAGVDRSLPPPDELRRRARGAGYVAASDLRRAVQSARWLTSRRDLHIDRVFREAALPEPPFASVRLNPWVWGTAMRVAWFMGWSPRVESVFRARKRARYAAAHLADLGQRHGSALLVGHGIFNALIAWELCDMGWSGPRLLAGGYWVWAVYRREAN